MAGRAYLKGHLEVGRTKSLVMLTLKPFLCRFGSLNLCVLGLVEAADRPSKKHILSLV
jgi:hypothetical protein